MFPISGRNGRGRPCRRDRTEGTAPGTRRYALGSTYAPELAVVSACGPGKVREIGETRRRHLPLVATDRISAYDHILRPAIRDKGRILTAASFSGSTPSASRIIPPAAPRMNVSPPRSWAARWWCANCRWCRSNASHGAI